MAIVATLSLGLLVLPGMAALAPQGAKEASAASKEAQDPFLAKGMKPADLKKLSKDGADWLKARKKWRERDSAKNSQKRRKARQKFLTTWNKLKKKDDPLKFMGDMLDVFSHALPYGKARSPSGLKLFKEKEKGGNWQTTFYYAGPRRYDPRSQYRAVVVLPGLDGDKWAKPKDYFEKTWNKAPLASANTFFMVPRMVGDSSYDGIPDFGKQADADAEDSRLASILIAFGELQRQFHLNRRSYVLDCGKGNSCFGLRLATYFPSRFSGLVLRYPKDIKKSLDALQLESLAGIKVLVLSSSDTANDCKMLADTLNKIEKDTCTILEAKGEYPHLESQAEIDTWAQKVERPLFPTRVVVTPNHERFGKHQWVVVQQMEPLETLDMAERPRLEVVANRKENKVIVTARNVGVFTLSLNDALVDLDKEVTIVINGKERKKKFRRRLEAMIEEMERSFDPTHLYTAFHRGTVPKEEKKDDKDKKAGDGEPKKGDKPK